MEPRKTLSPWRTHRHALAGLVVALAACGTAPFDTAQRSATIQRTAHGVAHINAPDLETLAYGMAYAYAQDNVCMTADYLVTARGERSRTFGPTATSGLGLRSLPNEQIDLFVAAHMDDAKLARAVQALDADTQALLRGYVAGYNRYLAEHAGRLPAACNGAEWVKPMTGAEYLRVHELSAVLASSGAMADAMLAAAPPPAANAKNTRLLDSSSVSAESAAHAPALDLADAREALREAGLIDPPLGSNAWAFGRDTTAGGRGLLLGNPHFPWTGVNRFWQAHLTVPGRLDVMGVGIGVLPMVVIGFNKDVAWSHTVSTGKRFTLHELALVPGDPTSYLVDGQPEKMTSRTVSIATRDAAGNPSTKHHTTWRTRYGPVLSMPRAGLAWGAQRAYALQDANSGNLRVTQAALALGSARSVQDLPAALRSLGTAWVNTVAADRQGNAFYADASVVPDVDAAHLDRCKPSAAAAALRGGAGLFVLDGSQSACNWRQDATSAVPGLTPFERLPMAVRSDWLHNSNDSFFYSHPEQGFGAISPLVGDDLIRSPRTRSGLIEIPELLGRGPVTPQAIQLQLFANRNLLGRVVLPDLLAACAGSGGVSSGGYANAGAPTPEAKDGCTALRQWDRTSEPNARGAHLFREFWRAAVAVPNVYRIAFDKTRPVVTPAGLRMDDAAVADKVWAALTAAVKKVRAAGFALDATLASVQRPAASVTDEVIGLHGGLTLEGVLNQVNDTATPGITARGIAIDFGPSYIQTVGFDERGPVAQGLLVYGQSTNPASPHVADQLKLYARKVWPVLPFHAQDMARERVGEVLILTRP